MPVEAVAAMTSFDLARWQRDACLSSLSHGQARVAWRLSLLDVSARGAGVVPAAEDGRRAGHV
jgi:hypothetical protein